jgi:hypothetical protein
MEIGYETLIAPRLVDSPLKLRLLLLFARQPRRASGIQRLSEWVSAYPWAIAEALDALTTAGLLRRIDDPRGPQYRLEPAAEYQKPLEQLLACARDPKRRDTIDTMLYTLDQQGRNGAALAAIGRIVGEYGRPSAGLRYVGY